MEACVQVDPENIKNALIDIGPLSVQIKGDLIRDYKGGILDNTSICGHSSPDHAVALVGFDKESYIFKNSWGDW